jgi:glucan endo-1,3-beta-D-glucosidase
MRVSNLLALVGSLSLATADQGFNYGAVQRDGTIKYQADFQAEFSTAKKLAGTNGAFASARLYTTIVG